MLEFLNAEVYLGEIFFLFFLSAHEITEIWCSRSDLSVILQLDYLTSRFLDCDFVWHLPYCLLAVTHFM